MITSYGEYIKLAADDEETKQIKPSFLQRTLDSSVINAGALGGAYLTKKPGVALIDSFRNTHIPAELIGDESKIKKLMQAHKLNGKTPIFFDSRLNTVDSAFAPRTSVNLFDKLLRLAGKDGAAELAVANKHTSAIARYLKKAKHPEMGLRNGVVVTSRKPDLDVLSHELGHAGGKLMNSKAGYVLRTLDNPRLRITPWLTGLGTYKRTLNNLENPDNANNTGANVITAAGAIPAVTTLGEEARASLVGLKRLKEMGLSPEALKVARGRLGKAWGTYALGAAGMHGGANLVGYLAAKRRHKILEKKRAEAEAQK